MGKKYFTLSFDDGLEQDKRVIQLMRQYGLKGTFNLNAGLLGTRGEVKGLGTFSFQDCPEGVKHKWPFSYVQHNRIPPDEVCQVYEGMEIATHGFRHEPLGAVSEPAVTTRGFGAPEMLRIAEFIWQAATDFDNKANDIRRNVRDICANFPIY